MTYAPINFREKFGAFTDQWSPKIIGELNDYQFKLVKLQGEFVWHRHEETDEAFIVIEGEMEIGFRDGSVTLASGDMFIVPKGKEHRPVAQRECKLLLIEPRGVVNTGTAGGTMTAQNDVWI